MNGQVPGVAQCALSSCGWCLGPASPRGCLGKNEASGNEQPVLLASQQWLLLGVFAQWSLFLEVCARLQCRLKGPSQACDSFVFSSLLTCFLGGIATPWAAGEELVDPV